MRLDFPDLRCASCEAALHPFVSACPACGATERSLAPEARLDPDLGAAALASEPGLLDDVVAVANFYRFRSGGAAAGTTLSEGLAIAWEIVDYRVETGPTVIEQASVALTDDEITIRDRGRKGTPPIVVPAWSIVAAAAGRGRITIHRAGGAPIVIANRRGFTVAKPRPEHYATLVRWLAPYIAAVAERRWQAEGVDALERELALGRPAQATALGGLSPAAVAGDKPDAATAVGDALAALETLRSTGAVTADEYAAKRREILARL